MEKLHPSYKLARNRRRFGAMRVPGYETDWTAKQTPISSVSLVFVWTVSSLLFSSVTGVAHANG